LRETAGFNGAANEAQGQGGSIGMAPEPLHTEPLRETNCYLEHGLERQLMSSSSEEAGKLSLELAGVLAQSKE